jgi:two-component system, chemotaxis family, sensor kinase CheA
MEMIEDEELRELFRIESEEHIQIIEKGLLDLEKNPKDYETLHLIFREAHSMKGASRMLGISDIESIAHIFEEVLGKASRGEFEITPSFIDTYYVALDAMKNLVHEAVTGEKTDLDVVSILDLLLANKPGDTADSKATIISKPKEDFPPKKPSPDPASTPTPTQEKPIEKSSEPIPETNPQVTPPKKEEEESSSKPSQLEIEKIIESKKASIVNSPPTVPKKEDPKDKKPVDNKKMDTMRVEPAKLDALMVQAGELIVTKNRISNRVKDAGEVQYVYDETIRTILESKKILTQIEKDPSLSPKIRFLVSQLMDVYRKQSGKFENLGLNIKELKKAMTHDVTRLSMTALKIERSIYNIRMLSLNNVFSLFHRTVRDLGRETGKNVQLIIEGGESTVDKQILEDLKDPLMHIIRNSIDHGIETKEERAKAGKSEIANIYLIGKTLSDTVIIEISDDGKGIDAEKIKEKAIQKGLYTQDEIEQFDTRKIYNIIFHHGFSTKSEVSNLSGRGVGMDVVKNFVEKFRGDIETESEIGKGTTLRLKLPIKFSTTNVLIVSVCDQKFGIPTDNVILTKTIHFKDIFIMEGKNSVMIGNEPIYVVGLENYLELDDHSKTKKKNLQSSPCILLKSDSMKFALLVDAVIEKNEVIIKPFEGIIKRVRNVTGVTILDSGEVCIILNPRDLVDSILKISMNILEKPKVEAITKVDEILLIDDSLTTRVQVKRILESEGYQVELGVDGLDGWEKVRKDNYRCVITDVEMPNMDGIELTKKIKSSPKHQNLPVIILTSLGSESHIQKGMEAGASAYLIKSKFERKDLIEAIEKVL